MRIISWVNGNSAPSYHRCIVPLLLMRDIDVYITNNLLEEHFEKGCDIFMYNRVLPEHAVPKINELKEKYGFKICVDLDDYWELDEHHPLYKAYQEDGYAERQVRHITNADVVLVTHERLALEVVPYNKNVHVCPNAIPKTGQFKIIRKSSEFVRLFWQGSITHAADIELLQRPMEALGSVSGKIKMIMAGYVEGENEWHHMVWAYTAGLKHQYKLIPAMHIDKYYSAYSEADICLIPLVNSRFNRHKSNLKVLEAANIGLPVVASHVHPYLDMPLLYCNNSGDWIRHIKKLIRSKGYQNDVGQKLKEFCEENFDFEFINNERRQILEYVAKKETA